MKTYVIFGRYYGTQAEAKAAARENDIKFNPETDTVDVPTDKDGLIAYLNRLASQIAGPLNEGHVDEYTTVVERQDPPVEQPAIVRESLSVALDDLFVAAPLGQQLTLASIALENARSRIGKENAPKLAPQGYAGSKPRDEIEDLLS